MARNARIGVPGVRHSPTGQTSHFQAVAEVEWEVPNGARGVAGNTCCRCAANLDHEELFAQSGRTYATHRATRFTPDDTPSLADRGADSNGFGGESKHAEHVGSHIGSLVKEFQLEMAFLLGRIGAYRTARQAG
jgi:hypothetical protein